MLHVYAYSFDKGRVAESLKLIAFFFLGDKDSPLGSSDSSRANQSSVLFFACGDGSPTERMGDNGD